MAALGMSRSTFIVGSDLWPYLAEGGTTWSDSEHDGRGYKVPNGGVYSTIEDLARFTAGVTGASPAQILTEASRLEQRSPQYGSSTYGIGVFRGGNTIFRISHGGSVSGYTAHWVAAPDHQMGVFLLRNYGDGRTSLSNAASDLLVDLVNAQ
jgi:CubicO group peptidase (beta-lactamase class C family)